VNPRKVLDRKRVGMPTPQKFNIGKQGKARKNFVIVAECIPRSRGGHRSRPYTKYANEVYSEGNDFYSAIRMRRAVGIHLRAACLPLQVLNVVVVSAHFIEVAVI
jgi:hypothetical protein